jgi:phage terminase large subunit GpA-like protein
MHVKGNTLLRKQLPEEAYAYAPLPDLTVSQWANLYRILQPGISKIPGPWRTKITPYLKAPMDEYNNENCRHIVLCFGTQLGKTETIYNILGFIIDAEPYSVLLVYPREDDSKTISRTRLQPMIDACPTIAQKKPSRGDLYQLLEMHFPGMILYLVGENSPAQLAQKPCRNILRDEIDKYPAQVGKDADPLSLSEERAKSFWDIRKVIDVSSPTLEAVGIWKQLQSCDEIKRYFVPCPHCNELQVLDFKQIKWDKTDDKDDWDTKIQLAKNTAGYVCVKCGAVITDPEKIWMLENGTWLSTIESKYEPEKIGFQLSSLYSPWLTFGDIAQQFMLAMKEKETSGIKTKLQNFINGWLAEPWKPYEGEREESRIYALRDDRPRGLVPASGVFGLTAGIDTQDNGFYYIIRAWGQHLESWLIREGFVDSWEVLFQIVLGRFHDPEATAYVVALGIQDSAGHRTAEVYAHLRGISQIRAATGEQSMATPYAVARVDAFPGTNKPIPGGLMRYRLNSTFYKDFLSNKLDIAPGDPGCFWMHSEISEDYARQMTVEYRNDKGIWQCPEHRANHYWDCEYMALAAADILGIRHWRKDPAASAGPRRRVISRGINA